MKEATSGVCCKIIFFSSDHFFWRLPLDAKTWFRLNLKPKMLVWKSKTSAYLRLPAYWHKVMKLGAPVTLLSSTMSPCFCWRLLVVDRVLRSRFSPVSQQRPRDCVQGFWVKFHCLKRTQKQSARSRELHWWLELPGSPGCGAVWGSVSLWLVKSWLEAGSGEKQSWLLLGELSFAWGVWG